jgi:short-subunit dehydrogenase
MSQTKRPVALVTGASAGLGRELARQLVAKGYVVYATARRRERLEELRDSLPSGSVELFAGDVADAGFRAELWDWAEVRSGGVDLLINNAGVGRYGDFGELGLDGVRRILEVNVTAVFDLTQRAIHSMRGRGRGEIVIVGSVLGTFGIPYSATYVASKHAVEGMVKSVRYELAGSGVRLWAARPGRFTSEFRAASLSGRGRDEAKPGESAEKVARGVVRAVGTNRAFVAPTFQAALTIAIPRWLPGPFHLLMKRYGPRRFARETGGAIEINPPGSSAP